MEIKFINYEHRDKKIFLNIETGKIYGLTGENIGDFLEVLTLRKIQKGQLLINNIKATKDTIRDNRKRIVLITNKINTSKTSIINIMIEQIKRNNLIIKDPLKKITDSLRIVGLEEVLSKELSTLSSSETKLLNVAISLLSNPEILILNEPFKGLDKQTEKKLIMLLTRLKEQFKKTIIIASEDSECLYKYTSDLILIKNDEVFLTGPTDEIYQRVDFLKRNKFDIPQIVEFTHLAKKKKQVKIDYHKDVRDIIKDIYKHI